MIYITRKEHFNAAHKLYNPDWSEEKNRDVFGVCSNENWHGHNYEILVTVKGKVDTDSGMIINLKSLSQIEMIHDNIKLTGNKWRDKKYVSHSGYPGGQKIINPLDLKEKKSSKLHKLFQLA